VSKEWGVVYEVPFKSVHNLLSKYTKPIKNIVFFLHGDFDEDGYYGGATACGKASKTFSSRTLLNIFHENWIINEKEFVKESFDYMYKTIQLIQGQGNVIFTSCNAGRSKRLALTIKLLVEHGLKERIPIKLVKESSEIYVEKEHIDKISEQSKFILEDAPLSSKIEKIDKENGVIKLSKQPYIDGGSYIHLFEENKTFKGDVNYYFNGDSTHSPVDWFASDRMLEYYKATHGYVFRRDVFDGTLGIYLHKEETPLPKNIVMYGFFKLDTQEKYTQLKDKLGNVNSIKLNRKGIPFELRLPSLNAKEKDITVAGVNPILELPVKATKSYEE
jgi:hypothetical protein